MAEKATILREKLSAAEVAGTELEETVKAFSIAREEASQLRATLAVKEEALIQEQKQSTEKLQLLLDAKEALTKEFQVLANDVMARHSESFSKQNTEQIDVILQPLREKLAEFQQGLQTAHTDSAKERAALGEQIRNLSETSAKMTDETTNLTRALKGKAQTQGAWAK